MKQKSKKQGLAGGEMRMRVKEHCKNLSNHTKSNYIHAFKSFDAWRNTAGLGIPSDDGADFSPLCHLLLFGFIDISVTENQKVYIRGNHLTNVLQLCGFPFYIRAI